MKCSDQKKKLDEMFECHTFPMCTEVEMPITRVTSDKHPRSLLPKTLNLDSNYMIIFSVTTFLEITEGISPPSGW